LDYLKSLPLNVFFFNIRDEKILLLETSRVLWLQFYVQGLKFKLSKSSDFCSNGREFISHKGNILLRIIFVTLLFYL